MVAQQAQAGGAESAPLWVNRIRTLEPKASGRPARELLQEWKVHPHLIELLERHNISQLLPVQEKVIPMLIDGDALDRFSAAASDLVITAPTGQGKTLCYLLPIVNSIVKNNRTGLAALILAPTRELVKQIYDFCAWFVDEDPATYDLRGGELLLVHSCHGNTSFIEDHTFLLDKRPQIVVFTPGRFVEHFAHREASHEKALDFASLKWMVIDEVDLLLSQSFYNWTAAVAAICRQCEGHDEAAARHTFAPHRPQKILVSATIPSKSAEIDLLQLKRPLLLRGADSLYSLPENLSQRFITTTRNRKAFVLVTLVRYLLRNAAPGDKTIVFCSYKNTAHSTARMLELFSLYTQSRLQILELSARLSQKQREEALQRFQGADTMCLVCSDVGSRGMNFANTRSIINYDFPKSITTYIHRIGRTARATEAGTSYIIVSGQNEARFGQFTAELNLHADDVQQLDPSELVDEGQEEGFKEAFEHVKKMVERCLELENEGSVMHDAPLPSNWMTLLQPRAAEEAS
ncbi:ATP-dependent RNA helicase [Babesia caballi]|uniref:ATP-dependent RNA helicase n=1 Tax=Babesia caballi TaxID=5871 RepID=A0AAV4M2E4_BABCB|nr:ATP-dependent RNA helicase [Babesia caballi]